MKHPIPASHRVLTLALLLSSALTLLANDEIPSPSLEVARLTDAQIHARLRREGIEPAPRADDAALLRRTTLDLVGRAPTLGEARAFVDSKNPRKREKLVDRLLASQGFAEHPTAELETLLMGSPRSPLRDYVARVVSENRPWKTIFRELLLADASTEGTRGSQAFLKSRIKDLDRLTNDVSVTFFGVDISCAQCHDHPLVSDWKQDHYFGMKSFFNRSFEHGDFIGEHDYGLVSFKTTSGESKTAAPRFLFGEAIDPGSAKAPGDAERKKEKELLERLKREKKPPPAPSVSRRAQLVDAALAPGAERHLARALVNRLFYRFFGQGLVMPLDQLHSENPASHPELIAKLAELLMRADFDMRPLIRGIALSESYARSSVWDESHGERPAADLFAVANVRALTPLQYGAVLRIGSRAPESLPDPDSDDFDAKVTELARSGAGIAGLFDQPGEDFQISVQEALLLSNSDRIERELLSRARGGLVEHIARLEDERARVETAVWSILGRAPGDSETQALGDYLAARSNRPVDACAQLAWALLTSTEARFNH